MPETKERPMRLQTLQAPLSDTALWRLLLDPRGRIARSTWWLYGVLLPLGLGLLLHALLGIARIRAELAEHLVNLLLLWPTVAVSIKRWHDRNHSGWWVLVVLLPFVGWLVALVANGFLPGTAGANRFGAPAPARAPARGSGSGSGSGSSTAL